MCHAGHRRAGRPAAMTDMGPASPCRAVLLHHPLYFPHWSQRYRAACGVMLCNGALIAGMMLGSCCQDPSNQARFVCTYQAFASLQAVILPSAEEFPAFDWTVWASAQVASSKKVLGLIRSELEPEETRGLTRSGDLSRMLPSEAHLMASGWPVRLAILVSEVAISSRTPVRMIKLDQGIANLSMSDIEPISESIARLQACRSLVTRVAES